MAYVPTKSEAAASTCEPMYVFEYTPVTSPTQTDITRTLRNQRESPLLRLPAELRNQIYAYVLGDHEICTESLPWGYPTPGHHHIQLSSHNNGIWTRPHHFLALTATSRQLRSETEFLPFRLNCFQAHHSRSFQHFLGILSHRQRNAIRIIRLIKVDYYHTPRRTRSAAAFLLKCRHSLNGLEKLIDERMDEGDGLRVEVPVIGGP